MIFTSFRDLGRIATALERLVKLQEYELGLVEPEETVPSGAPGLEVQTDERSATQEAEQRGPLDGPEPTPLPEPPMPVRAPRMASHAAARFANPVGSPRAD